MPQLFSPACNTLARLTVPVLALVAAGALTSMAVVDRADYATLDGMTLPQPVPFSHRHHVGELGIDCRFCHADVERGAAAGLPGAGICMKCHSELWTTAAMLEPVRASWRTGTPLRWSRVYDLPDFVYFDHSIHLHRGVGCSTCHGRIDEMALTRKAVPLHMSWCIDCHEHPQGRLRPQSELYDMAWQPAASGPDPLAHYHVAVQQLDNCSVCHR